MRYINLSFLLLVLCMTACKENIDVKNIDSDIPPSVPISTTELDWSGAIGEMNSVWNWSQDIGKLHDVSVQLIYNGVVLDETNTNGKGEFSFPNQPVPNEGAYFQFVSSGYYNNVVKVDSCLNSITHLLMMPKTFPNINGEAISNEKAYITLKGKLQDPTEAQFVWLYLTNANNKLIGTALTKGDGADFTITTLANEELFLHYNMACYSEGVIPLGAFTQDTDLGVLLDQSFDFTSDNGNVKLSNAFDCSGNEISEYKIYLKRNGLTQPGSSDSNFDYECNLLAAPITFTVVTQNPRRYQEEIVNYVIGSTPSLDMMICEEDDTFIKYTIGNGSEVVAEYFTYANFLPNGQMVLKQSGDRRLSFIYSESTVGSHPSNVNAYINKVNSLEIDVGGYQLNSSITMNDGEFVEGTFSGEVFNVFETSRGILEGDFRARIQ